MKNIVSTFSYAWRMLLARPGAALLNALLIALGVATMTVLLLVSTQMERSFERDLAGVDVVVGAKGSPLQMILAGVLHVDVPAGNIPLEAALELAKDPRVKRLIPLSLGDSYAGARIVGTTADYLSLYQAKLEAGQIWAQPMQAVVGADMAAKLPINAVFSGSHGLGGGGELHDKAKYTVVGQLMRCGCVLDRLILTSTESVWQVHEKEIALDEEDKKALQEEREITFGLVQYASPLAAVSFPRFVNSSTELQAAAPALEITRLFRMVGVGTQVLQAFAAVLLAVAATGLWMSLTQALAQRRGDLAMLRMLGASQAKVALLLLFETLLLALVGCLIGLALGHLLTSLIGYLLSQERSLVISGALWLPQELLLLAGVLCLSVLAVAWPLRQVYRLDVLKQLNVR
ncbi:ABC transporter permease [Variovorax sp. PCZ-1]|uniref:ABC transporter permease n=1 Tax=Variovorax sp. PCZ-1 TaxID=2835533 RepID=UPI001BCE85FA|nr:ABC transporter permease [Variovorax sp. PCZ-1]MBS7808344.1 ABC transporter permease [Variovorax sp. PCZ-1]